MFDTYENLTSFEVERYWSDRLILNLLINVSFLKDIFCQTIQIFRHLSD